MPKQATFQIGKNGVTEGIINSLVLALKNHKQVRISVLQSATRDRKELQRMAGLLKEKMSTRCEYRIIGYTIVLIKKSAA